jgi:hypothetical protein
MTLCRIGPEKTSSASTMVARAPSLPVSCRGNNGAVLQGWDQAAAMTTAINIAISAVLGVFLADSPMFKVDHFEDLGLVAFYIILISLQGANIWAAARAVAVPYYGFFSLAVLIFIFVQGAVLIYLSYDAHALAPNMQGVPITFTGHAYAWTFTLITTIWFVTNVVSALITHEV